MEKNNENWNQEVQTLECWVIVSRKGFDGALGGVWGRSVGVWCLRLLLLDLTIFFLLLTSTTTLLQLCGSLGVLGLLFIASLLLLPLASSVALLRLGIRISVL